MFQEMYRLLKPGGRVAISDILAKKELPEKLRNDIAMYVGCIAGASKVEEYEAWLRGAGFDGVFSDSFCALECCDVVTVSWPKGNSLT